MLCGAGPIGHGDKRAAGEDKRDRDGRCRNLRARRQSTQNEAEDAQQQETVRSHKKHDLMWIVARTLQGECTQAKRKIGEMRRDSTNILPARSSQLATRVGRFRLASSGRTCAY